MYACTIFWLECRDSSSLENLHADVPSCRGVNPHVPFYTFSNFIQSCVCCSTKGFHSSQPQHCITVSVSIKPVTLAPILTQTSRLKGKKDKGQTSLCRKSTIKFDALDIFGKEGLFHSRGREGLIQGTTRIFNSFFQKEVASLPVPQL